LTLLLLLVKTILGAHVFEISDRDKGNLDMKSRPYAAAVIFWLLLWLLFLGFFEKIERFLLLL
jgi:hypothetical protein